MADRAFTVDTTELLTIIKTNRDKHVRIVEIAQSKYREMAVKELDSMLADAREGKKIRRFLSLEVPTNHTKEYDKIIGLLEMTLRAGQATVEVTEYQYACYVQDDWSWKRQFAESNFAYSNASFPDYDADE